MTSLESRIHTTALNCLAIPKIRDVNHGVDPEDGGIRLVSNWLCKLLIDNGVGIPEQGGSHNLPVGTLNVLGEDGRILASLMSSVGVDLTADGSCENGIEHSFFVIRWLGAQSVLLRKRLPNGGDGSYVRSFKRRGDVARCYTAGQITRREAKKEIKKIKKMIKKR